MASPNVTPVYRAAVQFALVCIHLSDGTTVRFRTRSDRDHQALERTWQELLIAALRVELWDISGEYRNVVCSEVKSVTIEDADDRPLPTAPGPLAKWFFNSGEMSARDRG